MIYPPSLDWYGGSWTLQNGSPVLASHVSEVDIYSAWLAACRRYVQPAALGGPLVKASTDYLPERIGLWVPPYCGSVAVGLLTSGGGTVRLQCSSDAHRVQVVIPQSGDERVWTWTQSPQPDATEDDLDRELSVAALAHPLAVTVDLSIYATEAGTPLKVWGAMLLPRPAVGQDVLV